MKPSEFVRGFQWDLARQMERVDYLLARIPLYGEWGYNQACLYLEDAFDYPSVPGVGRKGALTPEQMRKLTQLAVRHGITSVPVVPLMGHTSYLMKAPGLLRLAEKHDDSGNPLQCGQICPLHPDTPVVARKLIHDLAPYCTAGLIHVGLDESFEIGTCPQCREEVRRIGLARHFVHHIRRLHAVCRDEGLRMAMWGDMLYYMLDAIPLLPKDIVVYDWYYYPFKRTPKVELYNFANVDLTGRLRAAGIDVYGCPNNGPFGYEPVAPFRDRLRNVMSWWDYCRRKQAQGMVITSWASTRTSPELNSLVDAAAASLWLEPDRRKPEQMLEAGVRRLWKVNSPEVVRIASALEKYQYAGHFAWQTYTNWRALATGDSPAVWQEEERHYAGLAARARRTTLPTSLALILPMRHYIAAKDRFLAENAGRIFRMRKAVRQQRLQRIQGLAQRIQKEAAMLLELNRRAQKAGSALWRYTRHANEDNPMESMLLADRGKITELRSFLRAAIRNPARIWKANPLTGEWQLLFWVRTREPALQGTQVLRRDDQGEWKPIHSVWSIEFRAEAGNSRADYRRHHAVVLDWDARTSLELRLGVGGMGRLEMYDLFLTNGVDRLMPAAVLKGDGVVSHPERLTGSRMPYTRFGMLAPQAGFPQIDWAAPQSWVTLEFEGVK